MAKRRAARAILFTLVSVARGGEASPVSVAAGDSEAVVLTCDPRFHGDCPREAATPEELDFVSRVRPKAPSLYRLAAVELDPEAAGPFARDLQAVQQVMTDLEEVSKTCGELGFKGRAILSMPENRSGLAVRHGPFGRTIIPEEFANVPSNWCQVASRREDLVSRAILHQAPELPGLPSDYAAELSRLSLHLTHRRAEIAPWMVNVLIDRQGTVERVREKKKEEFTRLGLPPRYDFARSLDTTIRAFAMRVDTVAMQVSFPVSGHHDDALERSMRIALRKEVQGAAIQRSKLDGASWTFSLDDDVERSPRQRTGEVLYKRPFMRFCEAREFAVVETPMPDGKARSEVIFEPRIRVMRCD